jgi:hypothetical protein
MKYLKIAVIRKVLAGAIIGAALLLCSPSASGAMALIYELDHRFSGTSMPGPIPWAVATFLQVDANTVELHMRANNISGGYIDNWWFNFNGNASALQVLNETSAENGAPIFATTANNSTMFNAGRDAIRWNFSFYGGTTQDFKSGDDVYVTLYNASGLDIHQFDKSVGAGGGPNLYSGANVSGLDGGTEKIVDLAPRYDDIQGTPQFAVVPEASAVYLGFVLLSGALGGEILRRKKA